MKRIWILVMVKRGFIGEPEMFLDERSARARRRELRQDFNPDYDEIDLFEKRLTLTAPPHGMAGTPSKYMRIGA